MVAALRHACYGYVLALPIVLLCAAGRFPMACSARALACTAPYVPITEAASAVSPMSRRGSCHRCARPCSSPGCAAPCWACSRRRRGRRECMYMTPSSDSSFITTIASAHCHGGPETTAVVPGGDYSTARPPVRPATRGMQVAARLSTRGSPRRTVASRRIRLDVPAPGGPRRRAPWPERPHGPLRECHTWDNSVAELSFRA